MRAASGIVLALLCTLGCVATQEKRSPEPEVKSESCRKYYDFAFEYLRNGSHTDAIANFKKAVDCSTRYVEAYIGLATAYTRKGQIAEAESVCVLAQKNLPGEPRIRVARGSVCTADKDFVRALGYYSEAVALDSSNFDAMFGLGFSHEMTGDTAKAVESYRKAKALNPDDTALRYRLGKLLISTRRPEEGLAEIKYVVDAQSSDIEARRELAESYMVVSRFKDALAQFQEILKLAPDDLSATLGVGRAQVKLKEYGKAQETFEKARSQFPTSPGPLYHLADMYISIRKYSSARSVLDQALALELDEAEKAPFHALYGDLYFSQEKYEKAIEMYRRAVTDPTYGRYAENQINRAKVRIEKRRLEEEGF